MLFQKYIITKRFDTFRLMLKVFNVLLNFTNKNTLLLVQMVLTLIYYYNNITHIDLDLFLFQHSSIITQ